MKCFVLLLLFVCGVYSSLGPKECAKGPEYWCRDLKTAKECGATKHCIQNIWEKFLMPKDESDICDTCKKMVAEARDQLLSNETQEEIRQVLEGTCHIYFPVKFLADECIKYVDEYIPQLIEMLASRMDPQTVCATAGLCNAASLQVKLFTRQFENSISHVSTPTDCRDCKQFISDVQADIHSATKDQVEQRLLGVCQQLTQFSSECSNLVTQYFDQIYQVLMNDVEPKGVCHLVGMCDETNNQLPPVKSVFELFVEQKSDPECEFCEAIIQHIKDLITANTTEEELKEVLLGICKSLGSLEQQCEDFVNKNFDLIFNFITSEMDPKAICTALGVCTQIQKIVPFTGESNDVNAVPYRISKDKVKVPLTKVEQSKKQVVYALPNSRYMPQALTGQENSLTCVLCEYVMHEIQNMLQDNKSEAAIKHAVETVCKVLPQTIANECVAFIEMYGDAIIVLISQEIDPSTLCTTLGLCPGTKNFNVHTKFPMSKLNLAMPIKKKVVMNNGESVCELCQMVAEVLKQLLGDKSTQEQIEHALDSVCQELPQQYQSDCKSFIDEYVEELIDLLQTTDPKEICGLLGLCPSSNGKIVQLKMDTCDTCQTVVNFMQKLLSDDEFDKDVTNLASKVCDILPSSLKDVCQSVILTYGDYILQLLANMADSQTICQDIELCTRPSGAVHLLGGKKCTYGPAYWCKNVMNAKACHAEEHCKKYVWKN